MDLLLVDLPPEILVEVLAFLPWSDVALNVAAATRLFHLLVNGGTVQ